LQIAITGGQSRIDRVGRINNPKEINIMKTQRKVMSILVLALITSLIACVQRLPAPEQATPTAGAVTSPEATGVIDTIFLIATQTALAAQGTPGAPVEPTVDLSILTPSPALPTADLSQPPTLTPPATGPLGPAPTVVVPTTYVLNRGEHPYCLGRRFDINPVDILAANGLSSSSALPVGMRLNIPTNGRPFPGNRALQHHPTTYTAKANDTIYTIACYFGDVAPELIIWANSLTEPYRITAGQQLNIP
jgi:LysM repeat protein